jgi:septal ring factor EnvC (AmiA/AmiB activator)
LNRINARLDNIDKRLDHAETRTEASFAQMAREFNAALERQNDRLSADIKASSNLAQQLSNDMERMDASIRKMENRPPPPRSASKATFLNTPLKSHIPPPFHALPSA